MWMADDQIRFFRLSSNNVGESIIISSDGTNQRTGGGDLRVLQTGMWSPDGSKVLFSKKTGDSIYPLSGKFGRFRRTETVVPAGDITWSHDNKQLVYNAYIAPGSRDSEIFVYSLETRKSVNISNNPAFDSKHPSFSPDRKTNNIRLKPGWEC